MVPPLDNDTINTRSRLHFDSMTPGNQLTHILKTLSENDERIAHLLRRDQIDFNTFGDEPVSGTVTVTNPIRRPLLITDLLATWAVQTIPLTTLNPLPALGASPATVFNNNPYTVAATITGGTVSAIAVNGTTTGATSGTFYVPAGGTLTVTYTVAPALTTAQITTNLPPVNGTATITFGGRTFQCNYASGQFLSASMHGLQLENLAASAKVTLTVSPASACHLEIAGSADYRKVERI